MFEPDYHYMLDVLANRRPARLPIYEHIISPVIMERVQGTTFAALEEAEGDDLCKFFTEFCRFFRDMTYDTVSYEVCVVDILPEHGAILGGRPGPIQSRADFERYPWDELPELFWRRAEPRFAMLGKCLPPGMKAIGGVGNGVFEISEDLVGFEYLSYLRADDPELFAEVYQRIGNLMVALWTRLLERFGDHFCICRFGDDLGFKTSLLTSPAVIRQAVLPQYRRVIDLIHSFGKPFLWHSCGCIFDVMDDVLALGIDAKHSNEDVIAPYERWICDYSQRIGLVGGIDMDLLCRLKPDEVYELVLDRGRRFRRDARGYALGSGNSIPDYVPVEGYLAMVRAAQQIRAEEAGQGSAS
jgi:uroporphyrinogen decarboxylase